MFFVALALAAGPDDVEAVASLDAETRCALAQALAIEAGNRVALGDVSRHFGEARLLPLLDGEQRLVPSGVPCAAVQGLDAVIRILGTESPWPGTFVALALERAERREEGLFVVFSWHEDVTPVGPGDDGLVVGWPLALSPAPTFVVEAVVGADGVRVERSALEFLAGMPAHEVPRIDVEGIVADLRRLAASADPVDAVGRAIESGRVDDAARLLAEAPVDAARRDALIAAAARVALAAWEERVHAEDARNAVRFVVERVPLPDDHPLRAAARF